MELSGKRIALGVTGGIAAYKAAELVRLLIKQGASVQVAITEAATHFIGPTTFQALSGKHVFVEQWDTSAGNSMAHINFSREADILLVAPATANFIAKVAHGLADDLLSSLTLARNCPLLVAPAMNLQMWGNPGHATQHRHPARRWRDHPRPGLWRTSLRRNRRRPHARTGGHLR